MKVKPRRFEGSTADKKADRAGAKRAGVSQRQWENSAADKRIDRAGQRKLNARKKKSASGLSPGSAE